MVENNKNIAKHKHRATAKDVAEKAGVSVSAVSRSFTPSASVAHATKKKVLDAARLLKYRPNLMARSLMTQRTELIGLVTNNFYNPVFNQMFDLFTSELQNRGKRPLLVNLTNVTDHNDFADNLSQYNVDGILIASSTLSNNFIESCLKSNIPTVHAFGKPDGQSDVNIVTADNVKGGELAAQILLDNGYKNIGFLGGPISSNTTQDRFYGFKNCLKKAGISLKETIYCENYAYDSGKQQMAKIINNAKCDAVFCGDDILAIGAMDYCKTQNVKIPEQMALIGFNNIEMTAWSIFDLTTIQQPIDDIIISSVELLLNIIENPERSNETRLFQCRPIIRHST